MDAGHRIKERRKELNMTVAELARSAGIKPSTLYDLERGSSQSSRRLHVLCSRLGLNPQWVESGDGARLTTENPREKGLEIVYAGEPITPETVRLAAQIESLDGAVRQHVAGLIKSLAERSSSDKR
jgi:transcriptional regulator with XRE-family HTH domain